MHIVNELSVSKNSKCFWNVVNKYGRRPSSSSVIDPLLDGYISHKEIMRSLNKCKLSKAPEIDGIDYSF